MLDFDFYALITHEFKLPYMQWARKAHAAGELFDPAVVKKHIGDLITQAGGRVDYVEVGSWAMQCIPYSHIRVHC